MQIIPN